MRDDTTVEPAPDPREALLVRAVASFDVALAGLEDGTCLPLAQPLVKLEESLAFGFGGGCRESRQDQRRRFVLGEDAVTILIAA